MNWVRVVIAGLLLALFTGTGTAGAHTTLKSTDPAQDAELSVGPQRVSATFEGELQDSFAAMTVVGPDHHLWQDGQPAVHGAVASIGVRPLGPAGTYTVYYRVTSADGHPVSGSWAFRLTTAGTGEPGPALADPLPAPSPPGGELPIWPFVVGAVVIVGAGLWVAQRRR